MQSWRKRFTTQDEDERTQSSGRQRVQSEGQGRGRKSFLCKKKCFICQSMRHLMRNCDKKSSGKRQQKELYQRRGFADSKSFVVKGTEENTENAWFVDSGSSEHICCNSSKFQNLHQARRRFVTLANGEKAELTGEGDLNVLGL
ncbi:hypothetical protein JRQ81_019474, partial [Phrynocephalus forsythii]